MFIFEDVCLFRAIQLDYTYVLYNLRYIRFDNRRFKFGDIQNYACIILLKRTHNFNEWFKTQYIPFSIITNLQDLSFRATTCHLILKGPQTKLLALFFLLFLPFFVVFNTPCLHSRSVESQKMH